MAYRPLFTGLGIIAGYLAALLGLSFYVRRRIGPALWRQGPQSDRRRLRARRCHTLGAGTDASTPWMRAFLATTAPPIAVLFVARLINARRDAPEQSPAAALAPRPRRHAIAPSRAS